MKLRLFGTMMCLVTLFFQPVQMNAQSDSSESGPYITVDLVSRYVWRGADYGNAAAIQPSLGYSFKDIIEIGVWGTYAIGNAYSEVDPYLKFSWKGISLTINDYFCSILDTIEGPGYFDFGSKSTNHTFEAVLGYEGPESFPIKAMVGTFFYGNDRLWGYDETKDSLVENYYSTYAELGYSFSCKEIDFSVFAGITPFAGAYGNDIGIINFGVTGEKTIKITKDLELPLKASFIANPQAEKVFFTIGITL